MSDRRTQHSLDQVLAFQYVTVENAPEYRAIVQAFFDARARYEIELRPAEVAARLAEPPWYFTPDALAHLDDRLEQLWRWGNLTRHHDTAAVARLEDFHRRRWVYHLSPIGDAAHKAVLEVERTVGRSGSLQTNMLLKIRDAVDALALEAGRTEPDGAALVSHLHDLFAAFDTLVDEADCFVGELNRRTSGEGLDEERFRLYKQAVLAYVSRFVDQLRRVADAIAAGLRVICEAGVESLVRAAARHADIPPALDAGDDPFARWQHEQRARFKGVARWFVGDATGAAPTVEHLAQVAVGAIVALMRSVGRLNERRSRPVDRAADFRCLARWFSACEDDRAAHALFRAAFGLHSARHFVFAEEDADQISPRTSWWEAPPVDVPIRLRRRGSISRSGRAATAADHSDTRAWIAARRRRERAQIDAAVARLQARSPLLLSDLDAMDAADFDLLLSLLDEALCAPRRPDSSRTARSVDGALEITLHPPAPTAAGALRRATISTPRGRLICLDYRIELSAPSRALRGERSA